MLKRKNLNQRENILGKRKYTRQEKTYQSKGKKSESKRKHTRQRENIPVKENSGLSLFELPTTGSVL